MTLATTPPLFDYVENGVTLVHAIPFQFEASADIVCSRIADGVETVLTLGVDYAVAGGGGLTGSVTKTNGGVNGQTFRIKRITARDQATDYTPGDAFPAETHEAALDRSMAIDQEQDVKIGDVEARAIRVAAGETLPQLPGPTTRASKFMQWALDGKSLLLVGAAAMAAAIAPFLPAVKGDPGGSSMAIGLFTDAPNLNIPVGTDSVYTSAHTWKGSGEAKYLADDAVDAAWVAAHPNAGFVSKNNRGFRLSLSQLLEPLHFGAKGDDIRDDHAETEYGQNFSLAYARAVGTINLAAAGLFIAPQLCYYVGNHTFDLFQTSGFFGQNSGLVQDFRSGLRWDDGCVGIRFQWYLTSGATGTDGAPHKTSNGANVSGLWLRSGYTNLLVVEGANHAVQMRAPGTVERCNMTDWAGHAVYINCDTGDATTRGNGNGWKVDTITATNCRTPLWVQGGDGNAGSSNRIYATNCRQAGPVDISFLANRHRDFWSEACGIVPGCYYAIWCSYGGNVFQVKWGQELGAAANAPPLTATDNTWWKYLFAGAPFAGFNRPLWTAGLTWRSGGAYVMDCYNTPCTVDAPYIEGGAPMAQTALSVLIIAPQDGAGMFGIDGHGIGTVISTANPGALKISTALQVGLNLTADGTGHRIGGTIGTVDNTGEFATPAGFNFWYFRTYLNGVLQSTEGTFASSSAGNMYANARTAWHLQVANTDIAIVDATGIDLQALPLKYGGNKVIGARGAAVADAPALTSANAVNAAAAPTNAEFNAFVAEFNKLRTDVDAVRTTGNTWLARARAATGHGLI